MLDIIKYIYILIFLLGFFYLAIAILYDKGFMEDVSSVILVILHQKLFISAKSVQKGIIVNVGIGSDWQLYFSTPHTEM